MTKGIVSIGTLYGLKTSLTAAATGNVNKVAIIVITISNPDLSKKIVNAMAVNTGLNPANPSLTSASL